MRIFRPANYPFGRTAVAALAPGCSATWYHGDALVPAAIHSSLTP